MLRMSASVRAFLFMAAFYAMPRLHWKGILLPLRLVEYIAVHELAHLVEAHHTPEFWLLVERALPDCERRRERLAELGAAVEHVL